MKNPAKTYLATEIAIYNIESGNFPICSTSTYHNFGECHTLGEFKADQSLFVNNMDEVIHKIVGHPFSEGGAG